MIPISMATGSTGKLVTWLRLWVALLAVVLIVAACREAPTPSLVPPTASKPTASPPLMVTAAPKVTTPSPAPRTKATPPQAPVTTPVPPSPEIMPPVPQPEFRLLIIEPANETILNSSPVRVRGTASLDAVVSINGNIVTLADDGSFNTTLNLLEGPNMVEIIATNPEGKQVSQILTVIYLP